MALRITQGKAVKTGLEKDVQIAMIRHDVSQADIAEYEDVTPQAINNRIKRLTRDKAQKFKRLIKRVAAWKSNRIPSKAAG